MLSQSSQTNRTSTIPAPGSVPPSQEYIADLQSHPTKNFPDIDEEDSEGEGEQGSSSKITSEEGTSGESDFNHLMAGKDFSELFQQFFVVGHKQLTFLRSKIFLNRDVNPDTLITPSELNAPKIQTLRKQFYQIQTVLFKNPKGTQYDAAR